MLRCYIFSPPLEKGAGGISFRGHEMLRYNPNLKNIARQLRKNMTDSERALWFRLRGKQVLGVQFNRQKSIGDYVVDFYAPRVKLVIEIDGSQHSQVEAIEKDHVRDRYLAGLGLEVMRFNSREVITNTDGVVEAIYRKMRAMLSD
jgi:very-short-patch-repair endonuclease